ncbi:hypothetical protein Axi01nite_95790 [Actinoplanes xinjiangensis]|nr:hypothetical protein Axi01nite_95790 [Actinoplanes xinjiangensis]
MALVRAESWHSGEGGGGAGGRDQSERFATFHDSRPRISISGQGTARTELVETSLYGPAGGRCGGNVPRAPHELVRFGSGAGATREVVPQPNRWGVSRTRRLVGKSRTSDRLSMRRAYAA